MKVLVVDDDRDLRETLRDLLEDEGFDVLVSADGVEALAVLEQHRDVGAIVLDLAMPVMDGHELYDRLRTDERYARAKLVIVTSQVSRAPAGVPLMKKPIQIDRLLALLQPS